MKVLNIAYDDYANFSFDNANAMKSVGIDAHSIKMVPHLFGYTNQSDVVTTSKMIEEIQKADIIQVMHSFTHGLELALKCGKKRIMVYHTGTPYRNNKVGMNDAFNKHVEISFTDQTEFIGTGMKNEQYIATAIDVNKYPYHGVFPEQPFKFAHYPSNFDVKGSQKIIDMMSELTTLYCSAEKVSHEIQLERMEACDIYIELFKPTLNGKPYGCFGVTAFEAAAMGKIVITNNIREQVYRDAYGECPFIIANDEEGFKNAVLTLMAQSPQSIEMHQYKTRAWLIKNHSYQATGNRLKQLLHL